MFSTLIRILLVLLVSSSVFAADGEVSFETLDDGRFKSYAEIGQRIGFIRPYIAYATNMDEWTGSAFHPDNQAYFVGVEAFWKDFEFSLYHVCSHPVDRYGDVLEYNAVKVTWYFGKQ